MTTHYLKTWPGSFQCVKSGLKTFEWRKNDRDFQLGDKVVLDEYDHETGYTGEVLEVVITYILEKNFGIPDGYCIFGFKPVEEI